MEVEDGADWQVLLALGLRPGVEGVEGEGIGDIDG